MKTSCVEELAELSKKLGQHIFWSSSAKVPTKVAGKAWTVLNSCCSSQQHSETARYHKQLLGGTFSLQMWVFNSCFFPCLVIL